LHGFAAPLCAVGVVAGLAGAVIDDGTNRSRRIPAASAGICGLLLLAVLLPGIGSALGFGRPRGAVDPGARRVVPLTGDTLDPAAEQEGWIDASRAAVQQGKVGIQVVRAVLSPVGARQTLVINVRVQNILTNDEPLLDGKAADPQLAGSWQATLTDDLGRPCQLISAAGQSGTIPELTFEPPPTGFRFLHLELPAAQWGGTGSFRFKIPATMVRSGPAIDRRGPPRGNSNNVSGR
jgi:hypothetical protein